jgi:hypothetical protein
VQWNALRRIRDQSTLCFSPWLAKAHTAIPCNSYATNWWPFVCFLWLLWSRKQFKSKGKDDSSLESRGPRLIWCVSPGTQGSVRDGSGFQQAAASSLAQWHCQNVHKLFARLLTLSDESEVEERWPLSWVPGGCVLNQLIVGKAPTVGCVHFAKSRWKVTEASFVVIW